MVTAGLDAQVPAGWVSADEVYGANTAFRAGPRGRGVGYVVIARHSVDLAMAADEACGAQHRGY